MREPELVIDSDHGEHYDFGMVRISRATGRIWFAEWKIPFEPHEWDELLAQLKAAIRYARKVAR